MLWSKATGTMANLLFTETKEDDHKITRTSDTSLASSLSPFPFFLLAEVEIFKESAKLHSQLSCPGWSQTCHFPAPVSWVAWITRMSFNCFKFSNILGQVWSSCLGSQNSRKLRQKDCKFKSTFSNLERSCPKIKKEKGPKTHLSGFNIL